MVTQHEIMFPDPMLEPSVRQAWESFMRGEILPDGVLRQLIDYSWQRCARANVDPNRNSGPEPIPDNDLRLLHERQSTLLHASAPIMACARDYLSETGSIMILTDTKGTILVSEGDTTAQNAAESILLVPGVKWSEALCGTNAIGTALELGEPVQIHSYEHYCAGIQRWTCAATVIRNPSDGDILGTIDVSGLSRTFNRQSLALAVTTAKRIENRLAMADMELRYQLLERAMQRWNALNHDALLLFDHGGHLIKANERAQTAITLTGHSLDLNAIRRIPQLAHPMGEAGFSLRSILPDWLSPEWIEPLRIGGKIAGTLIAIPAPASRIAGRTSMIRSVGQRGAAPSEKLFAHILTNDDVMKDVLARAQQLAQSQAAVLLLGETGVGKEEFARGIHGGRGPYVALNCGGLSRDLLVSELFGYSDGAFTGARRGGLIGKIEAANGGTLFLDEIGEMPIELQPQLLRVLDQGEFYRLGENTPRKVRFRLLAATHRDLRAEIAAGRFRMDLFYRIAVTTLKIPPLRDRKRDIPLLAQHFLDRYLQEHGRPDGWLSSKAIKTLMNYPWPGNVRELRNVIESAVLMELRNADGAYDISIESDQLPPLPAPVATPAALTDIRSVAENEEQLIIRTIVASTGNLTETARRLQIAKSTLYAKMQRYGITREGVLCGHDSE